MNGERKEVRRENKQVRSLKRLRTLKSKGKTDTKRFKRLKEKVYNPFPDKSPLKKLPSNPSEGVKKGVDKNIKTKASMRVGKPTTKKELDRKMYEHSYKAQNRNTGSIKMTSHPGEYLIGGGSIGGFKTAKTVGGKAFERVSKYMVQSAKKSAKATSIGSNSL
tara:strand:- start:22 stop:510 length:489 start_codon:yes stop_codon:yes gene_type:complete